MWRIRKKNGRNTCDDAAGRPISPCSEHAYLSPTFVINSVSRWDREPRNLWMFTSSSAGPADFRTKCSSGSLDLFLFQQQPEIFSVVLKLLVNILASTIFCCHFVCFVIFLQSVLLLMTVSDTTNIYDKRNIRRMIKCDSDDINHVNLQPTIIFIIDQSIDRKNKQRY